MNERELKDSIIQNGQTDDIIINSSGSVIDGVKRLKILTELGIKPRYEIVDYPDSRDIKRRKLYHGNEDNGHYKNRLLKRALERQRKSGS